MRTKILFVERSDHLGADELNTVIGLKFVERTV